MTVKKSHIFPLLSSGTHCGHFFFLLFSSHTFLLPLHTVGHVLWTSALLFAFCLAVFLLLTTAPPDCTQLPDASFPKPTGTYRCFLVSQRPSALQSSLSFSHLGSWHAYVLKGVAGVCIPLFEFPFGFNFMFAYPSGCWSSEKLHPQWLFDFMF